VHVPLRYCNAGMPVLRQNAVMNTIRARDGFWNRESDRFAGSAFPFFDFARQAGTSRSASLRFLQAGRALRLDDTPCSSASLTQHAVRSGDAGHQAAQSLQRLQPPPVARRGGREHPYPATNECATPGSIQSSCVGSFADVLLPARSHGPGTPAGWIQSTSPRRPAAMDWPERRGTSFMLMPWIRWWKSHP
jgi:hypothetical protein